MTLILSNDDIDRLLTRAVSYGLLLGVLTIGYLAIVVGIGALAGIWASPRESLGLPVPIVATALVSIGFQPVRNRARRFADRVVFGRRRTPFEALAGIIRYDGIHTKGMLMPGPSALVREQARLSVVLPLPLAGLYVPASPPWFPISSKCCSPLSRRS